MRRILLTAVASTAILAVAPATSLAGQHHGRHHHPRHARVEHFGSDATQTAASQSGSSATDSAGIVSSFSGGVLTIKLNDGATVSGQVNGDTEFECEAPKNAMTHDGGGDGSGEDSGGDDSSGGSGDDRQQSSSTSQQSGENEAAENENEPAAENQADNDNDENQADNHNDNDENGKSCGTANLTPGTVVREAELRVSSAGSTWKQVELSTQ